MKKYYTIVLFMVAVITAHSQTLNHVEVVGSTGVEFQGGVWAQGSNSLLTGGSMSGFSTIYLGSDSLQNLRASDAGMVIKYGDDGSYKWGFLLSDPTGAGVRAIATGGDGSVYVAGYFYDSVRVGYKSGSAMLYKNAAFLGTEDAFIARLDSNGSVQWTKVFQSIGFNFSRSIVVNGSSLIWLGHMDETIYLDNYTDSIVADYKSAFAAVLDATTGNYQKGFAMEGLTGDASVILAGADIDGSGNLVIAGNFTDSVDFSPGVTQNKLFNGNTGTDIFLAAYQISSAPTLVSAVSYGGSDDDFANDFGLDASDHVWLSGYTKSSFSFGSSSITGSASAEHILVLHFDQSRNPVKGVNIGNSNTSEASGIAVHGSGDVWITGKFKGILDFDPGTGTEYDTASTTFYSGFVAKYDRSLAYLSSFKIGDKTADEEVSGLDTRSNDRVFVAGVFQSSNTDFDPGAGQTTKTHNGDGDGFWADYTISNCSVDPAGPISGSKNLCVGDLSRGFGIATVAGATSYSWAISGGDAVITSGNGTRFIVVDVYGSGNFTLTVTPNDAACSGASTTLNVTVNTTPTFSSIITTDPSCGQKNGELGVMLSGNSPFRHVWSNGDTTDNPQGIPSGTYSYTGFDSKGCTIDSVFVLNDNGAPTIDSTLITDVLCSGYKTGAINLFVSGGTTPYTFKWSNGANTEDVTQLEAGGYRVVITDASHCMMARIINVPSPQPLRISITEQNPSTCGVSNGAILLGVSGGKTPYSFNWNTGDIFDAIAAKPTGNYWCIVADANNCRDTVYANLSDAKGPTITVDEIVYPDCGQSNGSILLTTDFIYSMTYSWSPVVDTAEDLTSAGAGRYTLHVNSGSCNTYKTFELGNRAPNRQEICMVTVDDSSSLNTVVWEKGMATGVKHYNIYRESYTEGYYHLMASWPKDSISYWIDPISEPTLKSWNYRISAVSPCNIRSEYSAPHRTVHVVMNNDTAGSIRINWTNYAGFAYDNQKIGRFRSDIAGWESIDTLGAAFNAYRDWNVPKVQRLQYAVVIDHPVGCLAQRASSKNFNSSRSNRSSAIPTNGDTTTTPVDTTKKSVSELDAEQFGVIVWPNPSRGWLNVQIRSNTEWAKFIRLLDIQGVEVGHTLLSPHLKNVSLDLSAYPAGVYVVHVSDGESERFLRIIKQ